MSSLTLCYFRLLSNGFVRIFVSTDSSHNFSKFRSVALHTTGLYALPSSTNEVTSLFVVFIFSRGDLSSTSPLEFLIFRRLQLAVPWYIDTLIFAKLGHFIASFVNLCTSLPLVSSMNTYSTSFYSLLWLV